jgi:hypothetical protein
MLSFLSYHEDEDSVFLRNVFKLPARYIPDGSSVHKSVIFVFMEQVFRLKATFRVVNCSGEVGSDDSEFLPFLLVLFNDTVQQS